MSCSSQMKKHLLICKLCSPRLYMEGKMKLKKKAGASTMVGGRLNNQSLIWVTTGPADLCTCATRILKVHMEAITGFNHISHSVGLSNTLLSQGYILKNGFQPRECGQTLHSKDRGEGEKPLIAQVQRSGPPAITSSNSLVTTIQAWMVLSLSSTV